jgi:hypothetical protein
VSSDGGALLLRQADRRLGLKAEVPQALKDSRRRTGCEHDVGCLLRHRAYGLVPGHEDVNDHQLLRCDLALQEAVGRDGDLASSATLCLFENRADRETACEIHKVLAEGFLWSHKHAPRRLILDFDATDDSVHGNQESHFYHGYYDDYCFLPSYVFCGERLWAAYHRRSSIDPAKHSWAILP